MLLAALLATACASGPARRSAAPASPLLPAVTLPETWRTVEPLRFEQLVDALLPRGVAATFDETSRSELVEALGGPPTLAVRAAVLLSRSAGPAESEALLARLEQRVLGPDRDSDAGDVVAAAGLAELGPSDDRAARLAALAAGPEPHPDLEVRVECGRSALVLGDDRPVAFLVSVLRIGTDEGRARNEFWPPPSRSDWARERAAEVLAWRAGLESRYCADASIGDREREASRLEAALLPADD